jgi:hypothetical protein
LQRAPTVERFGKPTSDSIPTIVRLFRSTTIRQINLLRNTTDIAVWQANYYEHVIRNEWRDHYPKTNVAVPLEQKVPATGGTTNNRIHPCPQEIFLNLFSLNSQYSGAISTPTKCLFNIFAATQVVPAPTNGSSTTSSR